MKFLLDHLCAFVLENCLTSQMTFSRLTSSFLGDFSCPHFVMNFVAVESQPLELSG